jgi:hypothetical protein
VSQERRFIASSKLFAFPTLFLPSKSFERFLVSRALRASGCGSESRARIVVPQVANRENARDQS